MLFALFRLLICMQFYGALFVARLDTTACRCGTVRYSEAAQGTFLANHMQATPFMSYPIPSGCVSRFSFRCTNSSWAYALAQ